MPGTGRAIDMYDNVAVMVGVDVFDFKSPVESLK